MTFTYPASTGNYLARIQMMTCSPVAVSVSAQTSSSDFISFDRLGPFVFTPDLFMNRYIDQYGYFQVANEEARLFACGRTMDEVKASLIEDLDFAWRSFVLCDPSNFHPSAMKYREWLEQHVSKEDA